MLHFCLTTWSSSRGVYVLYLVHDDHFAVFLKSPPSGVPLLASLVADHPKSGPSAPISGGLENQFPGFFFFIFSESKILIIYGKFSKKFREIDLQQSLT